MITPWCGMMSAGHFNPPRMVEFTKFFDVLKRQIPLALTVSGRVLNRPLTNILPNMLQCRMHDLQWKTHLRIATQNQAFIRTVSTDL